MSEPFKLYRLQQVDSQLDRIRARLDEIEAALSEDAALRQAQQRSAQAEQARQEAEKELRRAEQEVEAQRMKIEQNQAVLYGGSVRNPKELQDLQHEAEALNRYLGMLEESQLEKMIALEEAEAQHQDAQANLEAVKQQSSQQNSELTSEQAELEKEAKRLESERQAAASGISDEDMELYEKLRESRGGVAVALVSEKTCTACGTRLSEALAQAARSPKAISRCDTCGRILYAG